MKKYSRSKQYDETVLKKLHGVQVEMLHDFAQVCEKYELPYLRYMAQPSVQSDMPDLFRGMMI